MSNTTSFSAELGSSATPHNTWRPLSKEELYCYLPLTTSLTIVIKDPHWITNPIQAGKLFPTLQGKRLILEANPSRIIYILLNTTAAEHNHLFIQKPKDFITDVMAWHAQNHHVRVSPMARLISEFEVQLLSSILSKMAWPAFVANTANVDCLEFIQSHRRQLQTWAALITTCLRLRPAFMAVGRELYDRLVYFSLLWPLDRSHYALAHDDAPNAVLLQTFTKSPELLGRATGIVAGRFGLQQLQTRLNTVAAILGILNFIAESKSANTYVDLPANFNGHTMYLRRMEQLFDNIDVIVTQGDVQTLIDEVNRQPAKLRPLLQELMLAFRATGS